MEGRKADMLLSQAVLQHVDDLAQAYRAMRHWLAPTGCMTHTVDFTSHGLADSWNGHWTYSDATWKLLRGKRPYLLNRQPHSAHVRLLSQSGFRVVFDRKYTSEPPAQRALLAHPFRDLSDEDLRTHGAFIVATPAC
jgi:hypothetical protein